MRVWPWLLESTRSESDLLGHKHSGIYRHSTLNRHRPIPDIIESLFGAWIGDESMMRLFEIVVGREKLEGGINVKGNPCKV